MNVSRDTGSMGRTHRPLLDVLLTGLPTPVFAVNRDDVVVAWNREAELTLGTGAASCVGHPVADVAGLPRDLRAGLETARTHGREITVRGEKTAAFRLVPLPTDGEVVVVVDDPHVPSSRHTALVDAFEALKRAFESMREAHARSDAELRVANEELAATNSELQVTNEELHVANEELALRMQEVQAAQQADTQKNQFLAMLAHELRNPLAPIMNALYIIRRQAADNPHVDHALRIAERQVRHQARLLDDLLDVSRIVLGKIELQRAPLDLGASVRQALEAARASAAARAHTLAVDLPDQPLVVEGDATRLEQVVLNLVGNAVKYTEPGGHITVTLAREGEAAVLRVSDTGIGIAAEVLPNVFDLFTQADSSLARSQGGLGIGLTLAHRLVQLHGGTIIARSEGPRRGSEFEVRLPLAHVPVPVEVAGRPTAPGPLRILIVEDNADSREMLRLALEAAGHRVETAGDGQHGVATALHRAPDVVVIDIGLPGMDGYEVARRIRRRLGAAVRLVALTGYGGAEARRQGREAGFDLHLVKPTSPEDLAAALVSARR